MVRVAPPLRKLMRLDHVLNVRLFWGEGIESVNCGTSRRLFDFKVAITLCDFRLALVLIVEGCRQFMRLDLILYIRLFRREGIQRISPEVHFLGSARQF